MSCSSVAHGSRNGEGTPRDRLSVVEQGLLYEFSHTTMDRQTDSRTKTEVVLDERLREVQVVWATGRSDFLLFFVVLSLRRISKDFLRQIVSIR